MLIKPSVNVLVVEDDIAIMQKCRELLLNEGHWVRTAENVEEALSIVQRQPSEADIIILSLELPMGGSMTLIETLQKAHQERLILGISRDCGEEALEAISAGAYDCIRRNFTDAGFWVKVNRALETHRLRRQLGVLKRERQEALTKNKVNHEENIMAILNSLTDGLIVTDWQTNLVLFNKVAGRLFGLNRNESLGKPVSECIPSDELLSFLIRAVKTDTSLATLMAGEEPVIRVGDKMLQVHVDPVVSDAGTAIGAAALCHDVTTVAAMDKLRSDFLSMVSHELKAPLSSLLMQISVVNDGMAGELTEKQFDLLSKAKEKAKGMITLVNDLLDYRRIQEGKSIQKIESLDLREILGRTVELMRLSAEDKRINMTTEIMDDLPLFSGDRGGIQAIFVNLISNAIKYTPAGGSVHITLTVAGKDIRFKVVDNGLGIAPEDLDRIFDRFYRIKTEETRSIAGSGLGLSIVKGIVDAHDGTVHVESKLGEGTTFIVSLPTQE